MRKWLARMFMFSVLCCGTEDIHASPPTDVPQTVRVPINSKVANGATFSLEAFLYRPEGKEKHPLVLLSHGSSGGDLQYEDPQPSLARFFTDRGYVVLVPMRRGRGTSGGVSLESEDKNCNPESWQTGLNAAYEDVTAAIDFAAAMPDVDATRVLLVGVSRGGFLSVAYAAQGQRRTNVVGTINFVGGWVAQAEDKCRVDFNQMAFQRYGALTAIPELWLYGDGDQFYSTPSILSYAEAYAGGGGKLSFSLVTGVPENGHWLSGYPDFWSPQVDRYLASLNLPDTVQGAFH